MSRLLYLCVAAALVGCNDDVVSTATSFSSPSASVLAGSGFEDLFIANAASDSLQVLDLADGVDDADFVTGPSVFNPLLIPVGPNPVDLAASNDGRVVAVLDPVGAAVRLVDADARRIVRDGDGEDPYVFTLGASSSQPVSMEPDPTSCFGECLGRFLVSLSGEGQILSLSFLETPEGFRLGLDSVLNVGGRPQRMAASSDGRFVYAADAESDEVLRVDRSTNEVVRRSVDAPPGDVALSGDGTVLIVARPSERDVVVFEDVGASFAVFDANAWLSPPLSCVAECDGDLSLCSESHPASQALCAEPGFDGVALVEPYRAVYLDVVPRRVTTLSTGLGHEPLRLECEVIDDQSVVAEEVAEYAVIVSEASGGRQSTIRWLSLRAEQGGALDPELADNGFCNFAVDEPNMIDGQLAPAETLVRRGRILEGELDFDLEGRDPTLADYLTACPEVPDRERFHCLNPAEENEANNDDDIDTSVGVIIRPGAAEGTSEWRLEWEAAYLNATSGGGTLLEPGPEFPDSTVLSDENTDLSASGVRIGDIVEIVTSPRTSDSECAAALEASGASDESCHFERRVIGYEPPRSGREFGGLVLGGQFVGDESQPLPIECFGSAGVLSYSVRVGDAFAVASRGLLVGRAGIGELFGPGAETGQTQPVMFRIQTEFTRDGVDGAIALDARLSTPACERYEDEPIPTGLSPEEEEAARRALLAPQLRREQIFRFSVSDRTLVQFAGRLDSGERSLSAGSGPSSMLYAEAPTDGNDRLGYVFVTYETTDSMLIFRPSRPASTDGSGDDSQDFRFLD